MTFTLIVLAIGVLVGVLWHLNNRFVDKPPPWLSKGRSVSRPFAQIGPHDASASSPRRLVLPTASPPLATPASAPVAVRPKPPASTPIDPFYANMARRANNGSGADKVPDHGSRASKRGTWKANQPVVDKIPERDAWEDWDADLYGPGQRMRSMAGARLHIHFTDKEGQRTERDVTTIRYSLNPDTGAGVLYAHCHLRNGNRPFALKRISEAVDLQTGGVVKALGPYLDSLYEQTPDFEVERFLDQHGDAAYVLFCFAKADGALRAKEREAILDWAAGQGMGSESVRTEFLATLRNWESSKQAFWSAVRLVKDAGYSPDYIQGVWDTIQRILQSDKAMRGTEADLLRYTAEKWGFKVVDHS